MSDGFLLAIPPHFSSLDAAPILSCLPERGYDAVFTETDILSSSSRSSTNGLILPLSFVASDLQWEDDLIL